jgi:ssDNA thymidine ADP-ribosyltransferase, DarT
MCPLQYKADRARFEDEVTRRGINRLVHFTTANNLFSIFEQGFLLSRIQLKKLSFERPDLYIDDYVICNDGLRLDQLEDHINISIEHPNNWLFQKFREKNKSIIDTWCIISLVPECLYLSDTLFSVGNAASAYSKRYGVGGSFEHFLSLFQEDLHAGNVHGARKLSRRNRKACHPTDDQAEVLIKGKVPVSMIREVCFESDDELRSSRGAISLLGASNLPPFVVNQSLFHLRGNR